MAVYYVASLSRYVLVEADTPAEAEAKGRPALPGPVRTVRPATDDEVELDSFQREHEAAEARQAKKADTGTDGP